MDINNLKHFPYKVTTNDKLLNDLNHVTPKINSIVRALYPELYHGGKLQIDELTELCLEYPKTPVLKNILIADYRRYNELEKSYAVNKWLLKEHPDNLQGKLNMAIYFLQKVRSEPEKVLDILGQHMEIGHLYPDREEFHVEEIMSFNRFAAQYYLFTIQPENTAKHLKIIATYNALYADNSRQHRAHQQVLDHYSNLLTELKEEKKLKMYISFTEQRSPVETFDTSDFNFPEQIGWLYSKGMFIDNEKIEQILQLDRAQVTEDLEKLILDSIKRFDYFSALVKAQGHEENILGFLDHALLLLAELKSEKSFPFILEMIRQDEIYTDLWFRYFEQDTLEYVLYHCGRNQTESLFEFLKLPNIPYLTKARVGETLTKIIADSTQDRTVFIAEFRDLLHWFKDNTKEDHEDIEVVAHIIDNICDLGYRELLPEIKQLCDLRLVDTEFCGNYKYIEKDIQEAKVNLNMSNIRLDIFEKYMAYRSWAMDHLNDEFIHMYGGAILNDQMQEMDQLPRKLVPVRTASIKG